jgi:hypothetical protein
MIPSAAREVLIHITFSGPVDNALATENVSERHQRRQDSRNTAGRKIPAAANKAAAAATTNEPALK